MKNGQLKSFREKLTATETFKSLGKVAQKVTLTRNNAKHIENGFNIAKLYGYRKFERDYGFNSRNRELIKDLMEIENGQ